MSGDTTIRQAHGQFGDVDKQIVQATEPVPVQPRPHPRGHGEVLVVQDGYDVHEVDGRSRGRRLHLFHDLASIAAWLNRHATNREQTEIVMNAALAGATPEAMKTLGRVVAHLDPRGVDGDVVECEIARDPVFLAWIAILGKGLDQVTLAEHIRCYRDSLGTDGTVLLSILQQIKVTVGGSTELHVGGLGEIKLIAGDRRTEASVTIPPEIMVQTAIFDGVVDDLGGAALYHLRLFVSMKFIGDGENKAPVFTLTCPDLAIVLRKALHDAHRDLVNRLDDNFLVGFGVPKVETVPLLGCASGEPAPAPAAQASE